jgi:hypothetical protein
MEALVESVVTVECAFGDSTVGAAVFFCLREDGELSRPVMVHLGHKEMRL